MPDNIVVSRSSNLFTDVIPFEENENKQNLRPLRRLSTINGETRSSIFDEVLDLEKFVGYLLQ
jgi:hypothetical protein